MAVDHAARKLNWYRTPIPPATLQALNERSDLLGGLQTLGFLGLLAVTGGAALWAQLHHHWIWMCVLVFVQGMFAHFYINGVHELGHLSVFKTKALNLFFMRVLGFLGWCNWVKFNASHALHHRYTLHTPDDMEVVLPIKLTFKSFLHDAVFNPLGIKWVAKEYVRLSLGRLEGEWENQLFPADEPEKRQKLFNWCRFTLAGHALIIAVSLWRGWYVLPFVTTFAPFFGGWLFFLLNNTQHVGLQDNRPDFRLNCRSMTINPFFRFLYWHMNFHTEHHMYAAVPCYRLARLHAQIQHDLAPPKGLIGTWREIITILRRQEAEPGYQYQMPLPPTATPPGTASAAAST